jgi:diaminohydroxyphosphoribosylaminopyrimidine deaminase/5-amino-6-(5-phosphoribosylamino)uracil reductase
MFKHATPLDELYMLKCLSLAEKGAGYVSPNPMVGCVIVRSGKILGMGYHKRFGGPHAEVHAIRSTKTSLRGATLYVNLEPCNHFGKTPPCTDLIIQSKISRVVIGMKDPNQQVTGRGIAQLRKAGIEVKVGVLKEQCQKFNEAFTTYITTGLPFVTLKIAQTLDGMIADSNGKSQWISNSRSRQLVHRLRSQYDAVLIGAGTVHTDNARLTVREVRGRNPLRVILDGKFSVSPGAQIFSHDAQTIIYASQRFVRRQEKKAAKFGRTGVDIIELKPIKGNVLPLHDVLCDLSSRQIASVLVEGGAYTFSEFLNQAAANKLLCFVTPKIFGSGLSPFQNIKDKKGRNKILLHNISIRNIDKDLLIEGYLDKS